MAKRNNRRDGKEPPLLVNSDDRRSDYGSWRPIFLDAFVKVGTIMGACEMSNVNKSTVYKHLSEDETFRPALEDARRQFVEECVTIFHARARTKSDYLLWKLLKTYRSDVFKDHYEHTGPGGGPIQVLHKQFDLSKLSTADLKVYERLTRKIELIEGPEQQGQREKENGEWEPTRFPE